MFKAESTVKIKSKRFAVRIINLYECIKESKNEYVLSKQILRSGTSIGANISESECASSQKDFLNKMYIAFKECAETMYWLELLHSTQYITYDEYNSLIKDCDELKRMLSSITKTMSENLEKD